MSMINKEISDFSVMAFHKGECRTVTKKDVLGKWSVFFFYPADFTFVCPTELEDLADKYAEGGYLKLWIPQSDNAGRLAELRQLMENEEELRTVFDKLYLAENSAG